MNITVLNKINYHLEAIGIISVLVENEPFYETVKNNLKSKYNIPMDKLDIVFKDISDLYDFVVSKIDIPYEKLEFYFSTVDEVPSIGRILLSFLMYDDSEEIIKWFLNLSIEEKIKKYAAILHEYTGLGFDEFKNKHYTDKDFVNYINRTTMSNDSKYKYILMYYNIDEYLAEVIDIVNKVVSVLKEKDEQIQGIADEFKLVMENEVSKYGDKLFENYDIKIVYSENITIRPLLIRANSLILKPWKIDNELQNIFPNFAYIGIGIKVLFDLINMYFIDDERIISTLKALGDKSKFDILKSIKDNQMYGVEIAKKFNLTTATVSHHMSNLYNLSLINYVSDNNRMNYMLNKQTISEIINTLENIFLS